MGPFLEAPILISFPYRFNVVSFHDCPIYSCGPWENSFPTPALVFNFLTLVVRFSKRTEISVVLTLALSVANISFNQLSCVTWMKNFDQIFNEGAFSYQPQLAVQLCLCMFVYLSGIYSKSTMFSQSWTTTLLLPPTVCACMHVFVCCLFVYRLATETFSSLWTKLHSGYRLSRQPQSLSGTGSVFTLTYMLTHTHRLKGTPDSLKRMRLFLAHLGTRLF